MKNRKCAYCESTDTVIVCCCRLICRTCGASYLLDIQAIQELEKQKLKVWNDSVE
jgi:hypothetical protein